MNHLYLTFIFILAIGNSGCDGFRAGSGHRPPQSPLNVEGPCGQVLQSYVTCGDAINLCWNPNKEANIAGYNLYFGTAPGEYSTRIQHSDIATTRHTLTLPKGQMHYLVITAYNTADVESPPSIEVQAMLRDPADCPPPPPIAESSANGGVSPGGSPDRP